MKTRHYNIIWRAIRLRLRLLLLLFGPGLFVACSSGDEATDAEVSGTGSGDKSTESVAVATDGSASDADGYDAADAVSLDASSSAERPARARTERAPAPVMAAVPAESGEVRTFGGRVVTEEAAGGAAVKRVPMTASIASDDGTRGGAEPRERTVAGDIASGAVTTDEILGAGIIEPIDEPEELPESGQLTAGEWSDLREWDFWTSVVHANDWKKMIDYWGFGHGTRISVRVDNGREPIVDAVVSLYDKAGTKLWESRSDNHGRAELYTGLEKTGSPPPYEIVVEADGKKTTLGNVDPSREQSMNESPLVARLDVDAPDPKRVDVMFAIDATGSMGDELRYIKAELGSVIERVTEEFDGEKVEIRLGANVYRDESDDYLVRSQPMTGNIEDVVAFLYRQSAGGGGDTPEAVEAALEDAIEKHGWSDHARARLLFLVLDAPPHYTEERLEKIRLLTRRANELGIRIIPLSSSGVDKETEFLMRFLAIHTGGTYTFLTDHSGIGNSHIEPTIGSYEVEYLDDLIVRLIVQYTDRPESIDAITPRTPEIR